MQFFDKPFCTEVKFTKRKRKKTIDLDMKKQPTHILFHFLF